MLQRLKLEIWKSIHRLPSGLIHLWQLCLLQRLVKHAYENTGLYHNLWDKHGVKPSRLKRLSDLEHFPVVDKKVFLAAPIESYIGLTQLQFFVWRSTSGTSGEPFQFISINNPHSSYYHFMTYRFLYWQGLTQDKINRLSRVKIPIATSEIDTYPYLQIRLSRFLTQKEQTVKRILALCPYIIETFPSVLVELSRSMDASPSFKKRSVRFAISYGEHLTLSQRQYIENTLGCEVYNRYGTEEFYVIATECQHHDGLHLNAESFILEIVDNHGFSVPSGKTGRVIITDLRNYVMPFIRYDTGDQGFFLHESCSCGLAGKTFIITGRIGEFLSINKKRIHHLEIDKIMKNYSGIIIQYQMVKVDEKTVALFIIPGSSVTDTDIELIRKNMQVLIGAGCRLDIKFVTEIKRTPWGKCQTLVNL